MVMEYCKGIEQKTLWDWILGLPEDKLMMTNGGRLDFPSEIPVCRNFCWLRDSCLFSKLGKRKDLERDNPEVVYRENCYYHASEAIEAEKNPDEWTEKQYNDNLEYIIATYL